MVLMIFRPQGLIPARQKLLTYGRQLYLAVRRPRTSAPVASLAPPPAETPK